jgi:hypothetical protein
MQAEAQWELSKNSVGATFLIAGPVPGVIEAFWDPDGHWWTLLRLALSVIFTIVLVYWLVLFVQRHRQKRQSAAP